jgi:SAM-dependent methyltransferase
MQHQKAARSSNPVKRALRSGVRVALGNGRVRRVVVAELRTFEQPSTPVRAKDQRPDAGPDRVFVDRRGRAHPLDPGLRDRLKPGWRVMVDPEAMAKPPDDEALRRRAVNAAKVVGEARAMVEALAGMPLRGRILEIGCYDGSAAYELARATGGDIVATDLARYYVVQSPGHPEAAHVEARQVWLADLRERARGVASAAPGAVTFLEDDIAATTLPPESVDAIVSFEVLEHVADPGAAIVGMARLLRPGGVMYHDYNPFFSAIGGHSLCTLDFAWGHVRLDDSDLERYVRELRPTEADQALRFFRESLNRLTLDALRRHVADAGLELLALVPWHERTRLASLDADVLEDVRIVHPDVTPGDLLATFTTLVARRPAA